MKKRQDRQRSMARRIMRFAADTSGNAMMIMAISMIPIIGMVGSAFDMARLYMVKSRLQQACDAGALAGRKAMTTANFDTETAAQTQAENFFSFNYPVGSFGTTGIDFTPRGTAAGQVEADATATVPMTLMRLFNKPAIAISVSCEAILEIANTDVVFVLDVSGTMNCAASDTDATCLNNGDVEKTNARIKALRTAVEDFYTTINGAISNEARLRFAFVPYSTTVNMGTLMPSTYINDAHNYRSRVAKFSTASYADQPNSSAAPVIETYGSAISSSNCSKYGSNQAFTGFAPNPAGTPLPAVGNLPNTRTVTRYVVKDWGGSTNISGSGNKTCRRDKIVDTYLPGFKFTNWIYRSESIDVSQYKVKTPITIATGSSGHVLTSGEYDLVQLPTLAGATGLSTETVTWPGCLEERDTTAATSFTPIPSGAIDLDIDKIPDSTASSWRPKFGKMIFDTDATSNPDDVCPKQVSKLTTMTLAQVQSYLLASNGFVADGGTYHDIGILWGARVLSPTGIFGSENTTAPNGKPISRHIIYMTDGEMRPDPGIYSLYGFEKLDRRVMGSGTTPTLANMKARHNLRFSAICAAAKAKNITIWVVAYAPAITTELSGCANSGKAFIASTDQALKDKFKEIAAKIAELRLQK